METLTAPLTAPIAAESETPIITLWGHESPETAYIIPDYPYGRRLRCQKRLWIEQAAKGAQKGKYRICYQTTNPKASDLTWNKPHCGQYHDLVVLYVDPETGYVERAGIDSLSVEKLEKFAQKYGANAPEWWTARLNELLAEARAWEGVEWTITESVPIDLTAPKPEELPTIWDVEEPVPGQQYLICPPPKNYQEPARPLMDAETLESLLIDSEPEELPETENEEEETAEAAPEVPGAVVSKFESEPDYDGPIMVVPRDVAEAFGLEEAPHVHVIAPAPENEPALETPAPDLAALRAEHQAAMAELEAAQNFAELMAAEEKCKEIWAQIKSAEKAAAPAKRARSSGGGGKTRKPRGPLNLPAGDFPLVPVKKGSKRHLLMVGTSHGATLAELQQLVGWNPSCIRTALWTEVYHLGYGIRQEGEKFFLVLPEGCEAILTR